MGERAPKWRGEHSGVSLAVRQSDGLVPRRAYIRTLSQTGRMRYFTASAMGSMLAAASLSAKGDSIR